MDGALQAVFQLGTTPAFLLDGTGTVVDCNARARALFCGRCRVGHSCGAGGWLHALGDPPGTAEAAAASDVMKEARDKGVARFSWACRRPDGTPFDAELELVSLHSFDEEGYLCTIRDETERRRSEREALERQAELARETRRLQAVAEALNVSNNISFTFSGIRHELGNPVNALKTNLAVLKLRLDSLSRDELIGYVERALADVGRMEYLLSFLKSYSMFEKPVPQAVPLGPYLEGLLSLLTADAHRQGVVIQVHCERPHLTAWADPRALQQVLVNLVANSLDALEGRPAARIDITVRQGGAYVQLEVQDNGSGIPLGARQAVFQPFYTTKPGGSGLGLSIVKKLLASMNGTVEISSEVGLGTRIDLSLPMEPNDGAAQRPHRR